MIELDKGKTNLQLPEKLQEALPVELHPFVLDQHHPSDEEIVISNWLIEHFISTDPQYGGNIILLYNREDNPSFEVKIEEQNNNIEVRSIVRIERGQNDSPIRTTIDIIEIDYNTNSIQSILSSDQSPNDLQP
jgi:hypothetical protein